MDKAKQGNVLLVVAGALFAVGSFLDWATVGPVGASGMDGGDGWFTLISGAVLAVVGLIALQGTTDLPKWLGWAAWAVATVITIINLFDIIGEEVVDLTLGIGMYLLLAGAVAGLVGLVFQRQAGDTATATDAFPPPPPAT